MGTKGLHRFILLVLLLAASSAWSAELHGRSSTQFLWYNNDMNEQRQVEFAEYLRLSITNLDKAGKFSIFGYGRLTADLNNGEGSHGRLFYLYGDYRDLYDKVDFRLGRQFVNIAAGSAVIDGGQVDLKNVGPVAFTILGGRDVIFGETGEASKGGDLALGVAAYLTGFRHTDAELSWFRKWDKWDIARDTLGGSGKQHFGNFLKAYANARYDLDAEVFSEVQAGVKVYPLSNLIFTGEFYQSYPTFDTTSIYSVFAVNRYQEGVFRLDYTFNDMFSINGGYNIQDYGDDGLAHVYHAGCTVRPVEQLRFGFEFDNRQGYNGSTNGVIIDAAYDPTKELQLAAGMTLDVYERDAMTGDETARKYWLGGKYRLARNMAASLRIENDVNERYKENYQGRFVFDYDF